MEEITEQILKEFPKGISERISKGISASGRIRGENPS